MKGRLTIFLLMLFSLEASASTIGKVSENLLIPVGILAGMMNFACYVIGICFLVGAVMQYQMYRSNPKIAPFTKMLFVAVFGVILLFTPYFLNKYGGINTTTAMEAAYGPGTPKYKLPSLDALQNKDTSEPSVEELILQEEVAQLEYELGISDEDLLA